MKLTASVITLKLNWKQLTHSFGSLLQTLLQLGLPPHNHMSSFNSLVFVLYLEDFEFNEILGMNWKYTYENRVKN